VAFEGTLVGADGRAVAGQEVQVDLEPARELMGRQLAEGQGFQALPLGRVDTDAAGRFQLRVPAQLGDLTGYRNEDGSVGVTVSSFDNGRQGMLHLDVFPREAGRSGWSATREGSGRTTDRGTVDLTLSIAATPAATAAKAGAAGAAAGAAGAGGRTAANGSAAAMAAPESKCPQSQGMTGYSWVWGPSNNLLRKWVTVEQVLTKARSRTRFDWRETHNTAMEMTANTGAGGALATIGLTKSNQNTNGITFTSGAGTNTTPNFLNFQAEWTYRAQNLYCINYANGSHYYAGVYRWVPYQFTGGNRAVKPSGNTFACNPNYAATSGYEIYVSRKTTQTYTYGVGWSGLNARSQQTNGDEQRLTYRPVSGPFGLCGSNQVPARASLVREY
jgi:hypothetical protein